MADILASVSVVLGAEVSGFKAAMANARKELRGLVQFSEGLKSVGESMSKYVTLPVLAAGAGVLKVGGDFQAAFNRVQAATQAGGAELAALRQKAQNIALDPNLQFSSIQAAQALENLAKNGLNTAQILGGAADASTALATATGGTLAGAADITTDVMNNFGKSAGEAAGLVSNITGTTIASKFAIDDYRQALGQAGAVAGQLGVGFEEFNTALGVTSSGFSSGSDAGTSFKTFLQRLVPQSKEAAAAMKQLGLNFFDAQGKIRPLREVAGQLQQAFAGLSDQQRNLLGTQIFGADSIRTALLLAKGGAAAFDEMAVAIGKVDAAAQGKILNQGFTGGLEALKSSVEGLAQAIADSGLLAFAEKLVRAAASMAASLARLNPTILQTATIFAGVAAATGPVLAAVGSLGVALPALQAGFATLGITSAATFATLAAPIAAIAAGGLLIYNNWQEVAPLFASISTTLSGLRTTFTGLSIDLSGLGEAAAFIGKAFTQYLALPLRLVAGELDILVGGVKTLVGLLKLDLAAAASGASQYLDGVGTIFGRTKQQLGDGSGPPSELLLLVTGLNNVKAAALTAAPALAAFGGSLDFGKDKPGLLAALEAKLKALKEQLPGAQTETAIAGINQQIEATERQIASLEALGKSSKALAQLRADLAQAAGLSVALGQFGFDYVRARAAALQTALEGLLKEGFSPNSQKVREIADELTRLNRLLADTNLKALTLKKPEGVTDKPVMLASYLDTPKDEPYDGTSTAERAFLSGQLSFNSKYNQSLQQRNQYEQESLARTTAFNTQIEQAFDNLSTAVAPLIANFAIQAGTAFGSFVTGMQTGAQALQSLFGGILQTIGDFMSQFGQQLIGIGIGKVGLDKLFAAGPAGGPAAIAAGLGLVALAGVASAVGQNASSSLGKITGVGAGPSVPKAFTPTASNSRVSSGAQTINVIAEFRIRGKDLVATGDSRDYRNKRVSGV